MDLTNELADLYMVWWDTEFLSILETVNIPLHLYTRFKDDVGLIADDVPFGSIFLDKKLLFDENLKNDQIRENLSKEQVTMNLLNSIANEVDPMISFTCDYPEKHPEKKIPILDLSVKLGEKFNVEHEFYKKP